MRSIQRLHLLSLLNPHPTLSANLLRLQQGYGIGFFKRLQVLTNISEKNWLHAKVGTRALKDDEILLLAKALSVSQNTLIGKPINLADLSGAALAALDAPGNTKRLLFKKNIQELSKTSKVFRSRLSDLSGIPIKRISWLIDREDYEFVEADRVVVGEALKVPARRLETASFDMHYIPSEIRLKLQLGDLTALEIKKNARVLRDHCGRGFDYFIANNLLLNYARVRMIFQLEEKLIPSEWVKPLEVIFELPGGWLSRSMVSRKTLPSEEFLTRTGLIKGKGTQVAVANFAALVKSLPRGGANRIALHTGLHPASVALRAKATKPMLAESQRLIESNLNLEPGELSQPRFKVKARAEELRKLLFA